MLEAKHVVKTFDGFRALDGLTMTVPTEHHLLVQRKHLLPDAPGG